MTRQESLWAYAACYSDVSPTDSTLTPTGNNTHKEETTAAITVSFEEETITVSDTSG
jgi:hypothetical protein